MIKKIITLKIIIVVCVFQIAVFGQNDNKKTYIKGDLLFAENADKTRFQINLINSKNENAQRKFDVCIQAGAPLFKIVAGLGYFIDNNFEGTLKFGHIFFPLSVNANLIAIGIKYYENQFSTITYSLEIGGLFSKTLQAQSSNLDGVSLEADFGYLFQTGIGIYLSPNLSLTYLLQKGEKPGLIAGLNLVLGWILTE